MTAQISTRRQVARPPLVTALFALLVALVVTGAPVVWAVFEVPPSLKTELAWCCGVVVVLLSVMFAVTVHAVLVSRRHRERVADMKAEADQLADETLPALVARLRDGASVATALGHTPQPAVNAHRRIVETLAQEVGRGERMRAAAMSACANAAGRVQALSTSMLADLREMEHRHGEEVLGDLLKLDHSTAQAGRLADSIAVLTGARSGRRWNKPITMESILRGAMGRISAYRRVRLHNSSGAAVAGHAAEGVMHALAEIMDNATSFSPPSSPVHVYVEEAQAGVVVTVEDGGLVMSESALRRAEQAVSARTLDLMSLSGTRLGLAVVGVLAGKHGLTVSFRPSARGGTGVVVLIPQHLITQPAPRRSEPRPTASYDIEDTRERAAEELPPARGARDDRDGEAHHRNRDGRQEQDDRYAPTPRTEDERPAPAAFEAPRAVPEPRETPSGLPRRDTGTSRHPGSLDPDQGPALDGGASRTPDARHGRSTAPDRGAPDVPAPRGTGEQAPATEYGPSGLPKRRRGQTLAGAPIPSLPPDAPRARSRSHKESAARFSAFRRAVQGDTPPAGPDNPRDLPPKDEPR